MAPIFSCENCDEPVRAALDAPDPVLCERCEAEAKALREDAGMESE